jgi:hypothetical protein
VEALPWDSLQHVSLVKIPMVEFEVARNIVPCLGESLAARGLELRPFSCHQPIGPEGVDWRLLTLRVIARGREGALPRCRGMSLELIVTHHPQPLLAHHQGVLGAAMRAHMVKGTIIFA